MVKQAALVAVMVTLSLVSAAQADVIFTVNGTGTVSFDNHNVTDNRRNLYAMDDSVAPLPAVSKYANVAFTARKIDGLHVLNLEGDYVFSFQGSNVSIGGQTYTQNDLIKYTAGTNSYSLFWRSGVPSSRNLTAFQLPNSDANEILFTVSSGLTLSGNRYEQNDVIRWTPGGGYTAKPWYDGSMLNGPKVIYGIAQAGDGKMLVAGEWFASQGHNNTDVYKYEGAGVWSFAYDVDSHMDTALHLMDFDTNDRFIGAPEPATMALLAIGGIAMLRRRRAAK